MSSRTLLSGRVQVHALPIVEPGAGAQPPVKRLLLPKGELAQIYSSPDPVRTITYTELRTGHARGNHYHRLRFEQMYILRGTCRLVVEDVESHRREEETIGPGDLTTIEPGIAHAIEPIEDGHAIEFSSMVFDASDTLPYALIGGGRA